MPKVSVMVDAGKATASAPLGPALGPLGVNIGAVVAEINSKTKSFSGMQVPVDITVDSATKKFEVSVGMPSASALIKKEIGVEKGSGNPKETTIGNISLEQVKKIAKTKIQAVNSMTLKQAAKEIIGTSQSLGLTVEGKPAREVIKEIAEGKHDSLFA